MPAILELYCGNSTCKKPQRWDSSLVSDRAQGRAFTKRLAGFVSLAYTCRNCGSSSVTYFVWLDADQQHVEITKVGQWPPQSREPDPALVEKWDGHDLDLYRKAMTLRNSGWGIGSLPYLRRVIETHIHDILDLIAESIKSDEPPNAEELLKTLIGVRTGLRFIDKLDFARDHLPDGLTPKNAPNPIGTLYVLISDGIHSKTDSECIEIFDDCKDAFEFVVKKLSEAKRDNEDYLRSVLKIKERSERSKSKSSE